ncbi:hypothetical protein IWQ60_000157 [Tieghemiomyces parasiticus]|uniref:Uncharacterized protein n=1 Tax=Tieghemiomyces parasiticus TaxID=78921 RepID=A0A9W8E357_9FUNG|nr:hypothetical protein IWQ60_000157 [Tieghemiomyces parasiticus]
MKSFTAILAVAATVLVSGVLADSKDNSTMTTTECFAQTECQKDPTKCYEKCLNISTGQINEFMGCSQNCTAPTSDSSSAVGNYTDCINGCLNKHLPSSDATGSDEKESSSSDPQTSAAASAIGMSAAVLVACLALTRF